MPTVAALYHFAPLPDPRARRDALDPLCRDAGLRGTLILATEGINGTVAGPTDGIARLIDHLRGWPGFDRLVWKESQASAMPFARLKIRLKPEIVTMGQPGIDPLRDAGHRVDPRDWNDLIAAEDVAVIDTRNDYEVAIGSFDGAIDPKLSNFRDFPRWWQDNRDRFHNKRIAMFCTGGIRCEKSTAFLRTQGVEEVYHLNGGILKYLEEIPIADSLWSGDCFVFDGRVSVGHGLAEGPHVLCHGCRRPLAQADLTRPEYEAGVSCHLCHATTSAADKARFRERQRQITLARERSQG